MVASCRVKEINGAAPGTLTTVTTARFCTADNNNPGTNNPVPIPTTGFNRSFRKAFALAFAGTFTQINNVNIYTDGGDFGTGLTTLVGSYITNAGGAPLASYAIAKGQTGVNGSLLTYGSSTHGIKGSKSFFNYTSGAKKLVGSQILSAAGTTRWIPLQLTVASNAVQGVLTAETITWTYDEI